MKILIPVLILALAALLTSQPAPREQVGPLADGGFLLNSGWKLQPAGRQVGLDTLPLATAISRDGKHLLVLNCGYNPPSISVIDVAGTREVARVPVADAWLGLTFSPKGDRVYVGGGSQASVFEFSYAPDGKLAPARTFTIVPAEKRTVQDFIGDVALSPDGRLLYAASLYRNTIEVINPQTGTVIEHFKTGRRPYRILFHPDGKSFFVSSWTDGSVYHHQANDGSLITRVRLGPHPTDMVWRAGDPNPEETVNRLAGRLFVSTANTNNVHVIGVGSANDLSHIETINIAMSPRQPAGMTPSALALTADGKRLFVVCSDANAVAVADVSEAKSRVIGYVPVGWYPTAARVLPVGRLVVLNGRGGRSHANPQGPNPGKRATPAHVGIEAPQYVAAIQTGTASFIDPIGDEQLDRYTKTVLANSPYRDSKLDDAGTGKDNPIPSSPGLSSPIENVIYIVKENRTYDQVLGDVKRGNGDPSLVLFGEQVTPNHHKLASEFVLFDNFYVNSDVSADGHHWSTAAIAPDYVQKLWPNSYAKRRGINDYQGMEPTSVPPAGYLWTNAAAAGISMRNYGYWTKNLAKPAADGTQIEKVLDPVLVPVTNMKFRGFDMNYPDVDRAQVFLQDLAEFEKAGQMPRLILLRLGNDHTSGTSAGRIAPQSAVADNDYALGMIVEAVSKSKFWPKTAIFVLEDDAQNGPDHVDSHRSVAFVASPYAKRGIVDGTMYNTASVLRSMELILGLQPMTHYDAGARPMSSAFQPVADLRPYTAEKPRISLTQRNPENAPSAARSAAFDYSEPDRINDDEMNAILWTAIRGTTPPAPVRSFFSN